MTKQAFTLVEIIIVVAIIGMLATIAIPSFIRARSQSKQNACVNNLRMIDAGKDQAIMELRLGTGSTVPTTAVNAYIRYERTPLCPSDGTYTYNVVGQNPTCNIPSHSLK